MKNDTNRNTANDNSFSKKIGKATYDVHVFFSKTSKENFNDKLLRLIKNDVANETKQA